MGVDLRAVEIITRLDRQGFFDEDKKVLTLGRQHIDIARQEMYGYVWLDEFLEQEMNATVHSIDVSDYEGATFVHDLQVPLPEDFGTYDLILDFGTVEHIFDIGRVYENIDRLLGDSGLYVGVNGRTGWNSHGLFQFTPEFAFTLANKYNWDLECYSVQYFEPQTKWHWYKAYGHDPQPVWKSLDSMTYLVMFLQAAKTGKNEDGLAKSVRYDEYLHQSAGEPGRAVVESLSPAQFIDKKLFQD